ncbi:CPBP family intramembrane glutamic endopeptidase [Alkaliphilus serpentinus]|uniref:CPBP family intramembrane metalloprotease n=1 Tax=Alkaliphilus serpentinus TaxID=1482731 RepID=A0A833HNU5_9FIRM|nr:type II CAAX endopeptidase family protein [Alkaliphilus serpentinus]KAB3529860.1 CPBP family intramembrane metalloprotease [Alkaliphilus serpentinus]
MSTDSAVMKMNENLLWFSVLVLSILAFFVDIKYVVLLFFWTMIIVFVGNAKRFYSEKNYGLFTVIRRSLYVIPYLLPLLTDFKLDIKCDYLLFWCSLGLFIGVAFIAPKYKDWRIALSMDIIEFSRKSSRVYYYTQVFMLLGAAISEEIFFRNFIIGYTTQGYWYISILLSCVLFFLNHFGVKWNNGFKKYDYIVQITFALINSILYILSKSILPCIIAHVTYNSPHILHSIKSYYYHYHFTKNSQYQI